MSTNDTTEPQLSRRALGISALGVAGILAAMNEASAAGGDMTAEEKANVATVRAHFKDWAKTGIDPEALAAPIADECFITFNPGPPMPLTTHKASSCRGSSVQ